MKELSTHYRNSQHFYNSSHKSRSKGEIHWNSICNCTFYVVKNRILLFFIHIHRCSMTLSNDSRIWIQLQCCNTRSGSLLKQTMTQSNMLKINRSKGEIHWNSICNRTFCVVKNCALLFFIHIRRCSTTLSNDFRIWLRLQCCKIWESIKTNYDTE